MNICPCVILWVIFCTDSSSNVMDSISELKENPQLHPSANDLHRLILWTERVTLCAGIIL